MDLRKIAIDNDNNDAIKSFKSRFVNNLNEIYLDGNSLGKLPKKTQDDLDVLIKKQWGNELISSWNNHWLELHNEINSKMSNLINSNNKEVLVGESTSVNLYKIIYALLESNKYEKNLVTDSMNFPSDLYILDSLKNLTNNKLITILKYNTNKCCDIDLLKKSFKDNPGIYCLSLVTYKSSYLYPMKELNEVAEKTGSIIVWDCSHAIGVTEIDVKRSETKVALGCTYKFLNGGPGSPSFLYVSSEILKIINNPIKGWFGHQTPFNFAPNYLPDSGINRFASGTTQVLSMQAMEPGIDITLEAGIKNLRKKSVGLSEFFLTGIEEELIPLEFKIQSPLNSNLRGSHLTISHPASWQICQALIQGELKVLKVIPDYRPPNLLRFGITPLYTSYEDLFRVLKRIKEIVITESYKKFEIKKRKVT
jgi:kynureninase